MSRRKMSVQIKLLFMIVLYTQAADCATKTNDETKQLHKVMEKLTINKEQTHEIIDGNDGDLQRQGRNFHKVNEETKILKNRNADFNRLFQNPLKNTDRAKRRADYREPLSSIDDITLQNKLTECAVDTKICDCYTDTRTNRSHINCRYKNLYSIPNFTPVDTIYYQITFSANNYISRLPNEAFKNLKVERIDLLNNKLSLVEAGAFQGLTGDLKELLIEGNGVNGIEIPFASMSVLRNLRRLKVKNFKQERIPELNYFSYFPDLEALEFESVSLTYIDRLAFKGKLGKLLHLDFGYVDFSQIPVEGLSFLPSLSKLYIRFTKIDTIYSESFLKLTNLLDLDLSFNQIETLGNNAFLGVSNHLTHLDLGSNKLQSDSLVAISSKVWTNLRHLTLSYNDGLTQMPANVFKNMPSLQELFLVNLKLTHISRDSFTGLTNLLSLDLGWNNIESIQDGAFQNMEKLYELKLEYQFNGASTSAKELQMNSGAFKGLENSLIYLYLEGTMLNPQHFWNTLSMFKELQHLALSETKLSEIPPYAFRENKKLSNIELNNNGIKNLNQAAFKGLEYSLKDVWLTDNDLSTISDCVFKNFKKLDNIHLLRNPLVCDCRIKWLHNFIFEKNKTVSTFLINDYVCKKPEIYADHLLYKIPVNDLTCTSNFPERCVDNVYTSTSIGTGSTLKPTTQNTNIKNSLKLTVVSETSSSITVAWSVSDKSGITGFKLEYKQTTQHGSGHRLSIHRDEFIHKIYNLMQGKFYQICVMAEINGVDDESVKDCRTSQTFGESSGTEEQNGNENNANDTDGNNRNVIIGAIIATVAVVVLIAVGVCAVVKYKVQRLKELQFVINSPIQRNPYGDGMQVCVVPNEYSEIDVARLASKYKIKCPKNMQRQFGVDNSCYNSGDESSPYNTYQKIGKGRRKNPYENDDEEEPVQINTETDEVHFKNELELRHSAPSRLDAKDLKNQYDRNSRPLPATPADQENQKRSSTLKPVKKVKPVKKQVLVTKASVYNSQDLVEKSNETLITKSLDSK